MKNLDVYITEALVKNHIAIHKDIEGMVDLGLPSGTLWAECNMGANNPEEPGDYFSWGMTSAIYDNTCSWDSYDQNLLNTYQNDNDILQNGDDAAYVITKGKYVMPNEEDVNELIKNTNMESIIIKHNICYKFISKYNEEYIILPLAGFIGKYKTGVDRVGSIWTSASESSTTGKFLSFYNNNAVVKKDFKYVGRPIRYIKKRQ